MPSRFPTGTERTVSFTVPSIQQRLNTPSGTPAPERTGKPPAQAAEAIAAAKAEAEEKKSALPLLCNRGRRFIAGERFEPTTLLSKSLQKIYVTVLNQGPVSEKFHIT